MFEKIVAQESAKKLLGMYLKYAQQTEQRIPDIILSGHAGAGKSSIAREVATIANYDYLYSNPDWGAEIKRAAFFEMNSRTASTMDELYELLSTTHRVDFIKDGTSHRLPKCIIFFDEAHDLSKALKTQLLSAMDERRQVDFKPSKGTVSKLDFRDVTFVFATTHINNLERALITRCKVVELQKYTVENIADMAAIRNREEGFGWPDNVAYSIGIEVGRRSKTNMRTALLQLRDLNMFFRVGADPSVENAMEYYKEYTILDEDGLDPADMEILNILSDNNTGIKGLANRLQKADKEIEERISWMEEIGVIEKAGGGREITQVGLNKIGNPKKDKVSKFDDSIDIEEVLETLENGDFKRPSKAINTRANSRTEHEKQQVKAWNSLNIKVRS